MKNTLFTLLALTLTACGGGSGSGTGTQGTPVDQAASPIIDASHLKTIHADYAHLRSITGAGVTVAIMDSGVNVNHQEFAGKTLNPNSGSYVSAVTAYSPSEIMDMGLSGLDLYQPVLTGEQADVYGHGTHVTSLVWGENVGVAPGADVIELDIYPGTAPDSIAVKGLIASTASMDADFINASMTGVDYYESTEFLDERPLFTALDTADIGFVVAAGNFGLDLTETFVTNPVDCGSLTQDQRDNSVTCRFIFNATNDRLLAKDPDLADNFIWVGAIDGNGKPATFMLADGTPVGTNTPGADIEIQSRWIMAPGDRLTGAFFGNDTDYLQLSGTSQAAPLVTGAAALVKGQFPTLSNVAVMQILLDTADRSFAGYDPAIYGQGILDIEAALNVNPTSYAGL